MKLLLVGLLCALSGTTIGAVAEFLVLGRGVTAQGMQVAGLFLVEHVLAVAATLFVGLCIIAPLLPRLRTNGLATWGGAVLVVAIFALQLFVGIGLLRLDRFLAEATAIPGAVATALALVFFDRIAGSKRGAQLMTVVLVGFLCGALVGPLISSWVGSSLFASVYSSPLPGVNSIGQVPLVVLGALSVAASLVVGLCVIAPLVCGVATDGLRTRRSAVLVVAILAGQFGIIATLLVQFSNDVGILLSHDVPGLLLLVGATALPGILGTTLALALFDFVVRLLAGAKRTLQVPPKPAAPSQPTS